MTPPPASTLPSKSFSPQRYERMESRACAFQLPGTGEAEEGRAQGFGFTLPQPKTWNPLNHAAPWPLWPRIAHVAQSDPNTAYMLIARQLPVCRAAKKKYAKRPKKEVAKRPKNKVARRPSTAQRRISGPKCQTRILSGTKISGLGVTMALKCFLKWPNVGPNTHTPYCRGSHKRTLILGPPPNINYKP